MKPFIYNSRELKQELAENPHPAGEINFLTSIAKPQMTAIDAGSYRGLTGVALAKAIEPEGHVYIFEPVSEYIEATNKNLLLNHIKNASVYKKALTHKTEEIDFYKHGDGSGITEADGAEQIKVESVSIDEFVTENAIEQVDILSLDCEGSEFYILQGAKKVLKNNSPQILCEIHHFYLQQLNQSPKQISDYLKRFNYKIKPLTIENPDNKIDLSSCSHIYAYK
jgi:FkbM family methyltransferase